MSGDHLSKRLLLPKELITRGKEKNTKTSKHNFNQSFYQEYFKHLAEID
jgi:hypothetical protein